MQTRPPIHIIAAAVAAFIAVTGCEPPTTAAQPSPPSEPATTASPAPESTTENSPPDEPGIDTGSTASQASANDILKTSARSTAAVTAANIIYSATGFESLTATSWGADVTTSPPTAKGSGQLLVDGRRVPTDFTVKDGRISIQNVDGSWEEVGPAAGVLDPPRILDPAIGVPALLDSATVSGPTAEPVEFRGAPRLKVRAQLPAGAAGVLLPAGSVTGNDPLSVTFWLDTAGGNAMRLMILETGSGNVTVQLDPTTR